MKNNVFSKIFERSTDYIVIINKIILFCMIVSPLFIGASHMLDLTHFSENTIESCTCIEGLVFSMIISISGMIFGDKIKNEALSAIVMALSVVAGVTLLCLFIDGIIPSTALVAVIFSAINVVFLGTIYWLKIR